MQCLAWTDERVEVLKRLWDDGPSAAEIAESLGGTTRNAVLGKVHRLGLSNRPDRGNNATAKKQRKPPKPRPNVHRVRVRFSSKSPVVETVVFSESPEPLRVAAVPSLRRALVDLERYECRYPDSEGDPAKGAPHTFCGQPTKVNSSYCACHARLIVGVGTTSERAASRVSRSVDRHLLEVA